MPVPRRCGVRKRLGNGGGTRHVVVSGGSQALATSASEFWKTPLGDVALDRANAAALERLSEVQCLDVAHESEHSLEVQLPFLQVVLGDFLLLPLVAGRASPAVVAEVIELAWGRDDTLVLISSDLSHDYDTARTLDREASDAIEHLRPEGIGAENACGRVPLRGLLVAARDHRLQARTLDLRSSGDTAGPRDRVVGYGAYAFA